MARIFCTSPKILDTNIFIHEFTSLRAIVT